MDMLISVISDTIISRGKYTTIHDKTYNMLWICFDGHEIALICFCNSMMEMIFL